MTGRILALLATTALVGVGCDSNKAAVTNYAGGLPVGATVNVMSADADANTVRVADNVASVRINEFTFDEFGDVDTYSFTFNLPDGSSATFTDADIFFEDEVGIGPWGGMFLVGENADFDWVEVLIGYGTGEYTTEQEWVENSLFTLARVDPADDDPDFWYDTYMVTGDETGTLPEGSASYEGETIASAYENGVFVDENVYGSVYVEADFDAGTVDLMLEGSGDFAYYWFVGSDLAIDGSSYGGDIDGFGGAGETEAAMSGDLLGAFFGDNAEATAGVFGAEETAFEREIYGADVEIVGGFAAYNPALVPPL